MSLYNLTRLNKARLEAAVVSNAVEPLLVMASSTGSALRQFALPVLLDLGYASEACREHLWDHGGVDFYLSLLSFKYWGGLALNSLAAWLELASSARQASMEEILVREHSKIVEALSSMQESITPVFTALQRIIALCPRLSNRLSGGGDFVPSLLRRLESTDAAVRLGVLRLLRLLYERSESPRQFITIHRLYSLLHRVATDRAVMVNHVARELLKAFNAVDVV